MHNRLIHMALICAAILPGCSTEGVKRTTYEALKSHRQHQCLESRDRQACDDQGKSYNEYAAERERHIEAE